MLQDDGHLVRVLGQEVLRPRDARGVGLEGDIEMVVPGQTAGRGGALQRRLDDPAQGVVHHAVVVHQILRRGFFGHKAPVPRYTRKARP